MKEIIIRPIAGEVFVAISAEMWTDAELDAAIEKLNELKCG